MGRFPIKLGREMRTVDARILKLRIFLMAWNGRRSLGFFSYADLRSCGFGIPSSARGLFRNLFSYLVLEFQQFLLGFQLWRAMGFHSKFLPKRGFICVNVRELKTCNSHTCTIFLNSALQIGHFLEFSASHFPHKT